MSCHFQRCRFSIAYFDLRLVVMGVQRRLHDQSGSRRGVGDQIYDGLAAGQRLAAPVLRDKAEEPMLDFVPPAGAGREVTDHEPDSQLIGKLLQTDFPEPLSRPVASTSVGGDQQILRSLKAAASHSRPPTADAVGGELGGVVVNSDASPSPDR